MPQRVPQWQRPLLTCCVGAVPASMTNSEPDAPNSKCPKYPPPPRSGNAFAAAVFGATANLLLLITLLWLFA